MIVVSDTTPLSELAKVGKLTIFRDTYGKIWIPQEVYDEVIAERRMRGHAFGRSVKCRSVVD